MRGLVAIALLAAACGGGKSGGNTDCDQLAAVAQASSMKAVPADSNADLKQMASEIGDKTAVVVVQHCKDDRWSKDMIDCAKGAADLMSCKPKLTADQQIALQNALEQDLGPMAVPAGSDQ
jgi:hypothetical protein